MTVLQQQAPLWLAEVTAYALWLTQQPPQQQHENVITHFLREVSGESSVVATTLVVQLGEQMYKTPAWMTQHLRVLGTQNIHTIEGAWQALCRTHGLL